LNIPAVEHIPAPSGTAAVAADKRTALALAKSDPDSGGLKLEAVKGGKTKFKVKKGSVQLPTRGEAARQTSETVAKAKVTPLVIAGDTLDAIEATGRAAGGIITVKPFLPGIVGVVARESLDARQRARFEDALRLKLDWFGARLLPIRFAGPSARSVADELHALHAEGAGVLIVAGASALDPLDPVFGGLTLLGARMERHGAPAHPGSLLWVARWDDRSVVGMPTCGMFSQATTFDLVLPAILAGETVGNGEIAALGHGGLLSRDMAYRFPPYREGVVRGELA